MTFATLIHCPGGGSATDEELEAAVRLLSSTFELEVRVVGESDSAQALAEAAVAAGSDVLIASGGDGTVAAVAAAIVGSRTVSLGILPRGTANSISHHLGIPHELELACGIISEGHTRTIDTLSVNGKPAVLMATVGVHAEAITEVDPQRKKRFGALAYALEEIDRMLNNELFTVVIEADGQRIEANANAVTVANLAPPWTLLARGDKVQEDDGMLDVTLVAIQGFGEALATSFQLATAVLRDQPAERDNIGHFRTREVRIETQPEKRVMVDGEDATETPLHVRCVPNSLRVLCPPSPQP